MLRFLCLSTAILFSFSNLLAEEIPEYLAKELISKSVEIYTSEISIAYILEGSAEVKGGLHADNVNLVVVLVSELVKGRKVRRVKHYTFYRNEKLGWFCSFVKQRGKSKYIEIFSQRGGVISIK